jgi:hypothetical protein
MRGISIRKNIGVGDALQFSSVPENYFRGTGKMLVDVSEHWFFDHNPYVVRKTEPELPVVELWNFGPKQREFPKPRPSVYLSNAESHAAVMGVTAKLIRPRLYRFEDYPFEKREMILLHTHGRSHGAMPTHVIEHVLKKYKGAPLFHIGLPSDPDLGIPKLPTSNLWELAAIISKARMFIGMDSGPSWIAACYPDVVSKKIRTKPGLEELAKWVPLEIANIHAHWDDKGLFQIYNVSEDDLGFTQSYRKI